MSEATRPSPVETARVSDAVRRRRLAYRCWHRGTREMDFVLGRFADAALATLPAERLAELEALLEMPDPELFAWIAGARAAPADYDTPLLEAIRAFYDERPGAGESSPP